MDAGVIDQDVQTAETLDNCIYHRIDHLRIGDVGGMRKRSLIG